MAVAYFDTSAVLKNYVVESGSQWVRQFLRSADQTVFISQIVLPEVGAALAILARQKRISRRERDLSLDLFLKDVTTLWALTDVTQAIAEEATFLTQQHPLKGYDAVHLATALDLASALHMLSEQLIFVTGDRQLLHAAESEGLAIEDPFEHADLDRFEDSGNVDSTLD